MVRQSLAFLAALALAATSTAHAQNTARGVVFEDANGNGKRDAGERGLAGVAVSSETAVVLTDAEGRYQLDIDDDSFVFVVKPTGYMVALGEHNLARHYYLHKPAGSPKSYYSGVKPTGPLPEAIDFPLVRQDETAPYRVILMADTQPETSQEVDWMVEDVFGELPGVGAAFAMTLGDIIFDQLGLFTPYNRAIGRIGIPFFHVIGNHDLNFDAEGDEYSDETFNLHYGPQYYSFNWGRVHYVVLDNIRWKGGTNGSGSYDEVIEDAQIAWLRSNLAHVPDDYLVVVATHAPLRASNRRTPLIQNLQPLFDVLETRPRVVAVSGHTHYNNHYFFTAEDGWNGTGTFHQNNIVTVCGSWWSGPSDARGIPVADQRDGTPNGYAILEVEGNNYTFAFKAAGLDRDHQMRIYPPGRHRSTANALLVNVFDGMDRSRVEFSVNGGDFRPMEFKPQEDPLAQAYYSGPNATGKSWVRPLVSYHMWEAPLPAADLAAGPNNVTVRYRDDLGREFTQSTIFRK